jgi:OPA family glycerol-3-phosphate transporter-like MFS transporter
MGKADRDFTPGQVKIVWLLWATYGAFYFCRQNIAASIPGMGAELELSRGEIGTILGSLKLAYGVGQFVNGQLAERIPARVLLAIGMFGSAALNVVFGFGTGFYYLLFVWAANGYCQALGWTPTMRVASRWFTPELRGRAVGLIGTGYQLAGALTFVVAGWAVSMSGWRGAHFVSAAILASMGVVTLLFVREEPPGEAGAEERPLERKPWRETLWLTISNPRLWLIALALAMVDATRYGFSDWGLAHIKEMQGGGVGKNALKYAILPLGGMVGAVFAGYASDRWFRGRRVPVLVGLLVALGGLSVLYDAVVQTRPALAVGLLALIGFCIYGPQVLLVGAAAMDIARQGRSVAAVGFVNLFGYLGAFTGDKVTGELADAKGWEAAVYFWAVCAFVAAVVLLPLWRFSAARR